ncbi:DUF7344 domain-containing protein [Natrialba asiatica]|uniref:DUF7344 domain-containing protein n=1 Tax=Natrialba asiatica (strain ATCC 700177 / DSM 12278 / JCM 9576 / FERM P-10747 / NBRC 102637 / 172P1) TaxID=29540 RepID=M0B4P4_NATA1|nr:hypothetical protein C481_00020 [Natrialba asiatica DSM 12278]
MIGHSPEGDVVRYSDSDNQSLEVVFGLLANQRRRYVLMCLIDHSEAIALADLAEDVAVRGNKGAITEISKEKVRTIHTSLYHTHIPKLVEAGAVEYDQDRDLVRTSETSERVQHLLSIAADGEEDR